MSLGAFKDLFTDETAAREWLERALGRMAAMVRNAEGRLLSYAFLTGKAA